MDRDKIVEIGIDENERLYIRPATHKFPYIYREAMEVHWDDINNYLYSPKPREWTYYEWYLQILSAAKEQSTILEFSTNTIWVNISDDLKKQIESFDINNLLK